MTPERLLALALENRELAATIITLLAGTGGTLRHYQRTGRLPLSTLPWRAYRRLFYTLRKRWFTVAKPNPSELEAVPGDLDTVADMLGSQSYEIGWPFSYRYKGEDINARRYVHRPNTEYPHRQLHIRAWESPDGSIAVNAHEEPSALHHPKAHLQEKGLVGATEWVASNIENPNGLDPRGFYSGDGS